MTTPKLNEDALSEKVMIAQGLDKISIEIKIY